MRAGKWSEASNSDRRVATLITSLRTFRKLAELESDQLMMTMGGNDRDIRTTVWQMINLI